MKKIKWIEVLMATLCYIMPLTCMLQGALLLYVYQKAATGTSPVDFWLFCLIFPIYFFSMAQTGAMIVKHSEVFD